jgi:hypothetical protein
MQEFIASACFRQIFVFVTPNNKKNIELKVLGLEGGKTFNIVLL